MDADSFRTRTFIESYRMMRSKKTPGIFTAFDKSDTESSQLPTMENSLVLPQSKNTFLTVYDPLESI
jgi:hypothetical protein